MKYGVIYFSYKNTSLEERVVVDKHISINIGDYMQTLAVRNAYLQSGISDNDIVPIDRDDLPSYSGDRAIFIMNGCFYKRCFPISDRIIPVFVGFQAKKEVIAEFQDYFRKFAPIGCRDIDTRNAFESHGIEAYTTGCLTLSLPDIRKEASRKKVIIPFGAGAGALPASILAAMPKRYLPEVEFVFQRKICHACPLSFDEMRNVEDYANYLRNYYSENARLIVTPLHHAATPCMSANIPVIVARVKDDTRFSYLKTIMPIHTPRHFGEVDWDPAPVDIEAIRQALLQTTATAIDDARRR